MDFFSSKETKASASLKGKGYPSFFKEIRSYHNFFFLTTYRIHLELMKSRVDTSLMSQRFASLDCTVRFSKVGQKTRNEKKDSGSVKPARSAEERKSC